LRNALAVLNDGDVRTQSQTASPASPRRRRATRNLPGMNVPHKRSEQLGSVGAPLRHEVRGWLFLFFHLSLFQNHISSQPDDSRRQRDTHSLEEGSDRAQI
jgi:hypothetical protein